MERTDGIGADSVIICGGNDEVFAQAIDMVRYGIGTVSNVNYFGGTGNLPFPKFPEDAVWQEKQSVLS